MFTLLFEYHFAVYFMPYNSTAV